MVVVVAVVVEVVVGDMVVVVVAVVVVCAVGSTMVAASRNTCWVRFKVWPLFQQIAQLSELWRCCVPLTRQEHHRAAIFRHVVALLAPSLIASHTWDHTGCLFLCVRAYLGVYNRAEIRCLPHKCA